MGPLRLSYGDESGDPCRGGLIGTFSRIITDLCECPDVD